MFDWIKRMEVLGVWEFLFHMQTGWELVKDLIYLFVLGDPFQFIKTDWQEELEMVLGFTPLHTAKKLMQMNEGTAEGELCPPDCTTSSFTEQFLMEFKANE